MADTTLYIENYNPPIRQAGGIYTALNLSVSGAVDFSAAASVALPTTSSTGGALTLTSGSTPLTINKTSGGTTLLTQISGAARFSVNSTGGTDTFGFNSSNWTVNNVAAISFAGNSMAILSGVATPAGGSAGAALIFGTTAAFGIYYGSGAPTVSAAQGSIFIRSDGSSTSTRLYVNTNGSTTWTNFTSAA